MQIARLRPHPAAPRGKPRFHVVGFTFALFAVTALATPFLNHDTRISLGATAVTGGLLVTGATIIRRSAVAPPGERRPWKLFGVGLTISGLGAVLSGAIYLVTGSVSAFGPADVLFILGYAVGLTGLGTLPHTAGNPLQRVRLLLDGAIGAVSVAALLWIMVVSRVTTSLSDAPTWERIVGSAYPVTDVALLVVVIIVSIRRSSRRFDPRMFLIGVGAIAQTVADTTYVLAGAGQSFADAEPVFPLIMLALACFLGTAILVDRPLPAREYADRTATPIWAMIVPYGAAAAMVVILMIHVRGQALSANDRILFVATLITGALVIARQAVAIRENRGFVERQRTALVSSISHELRTPLTAMVGFLDILDSGGITDEAERAEVTTIVNQQAAYLSRIVSDLVMLASGNIDAMELEITRVRIDELIWTAVNAAALDPTTVRVDAPPGLVVFVDADRIQQALINLLSNAARYGGDHKMVVAYADHSDLILELHDNGPGVPRKYELTIWDRFERGPNRLNATVPGSGIGLAVIEAIAKAHGGTAGYRRSVRLGGACFWIRLPGRVQGVPHDPQEPAPNVVDLPTQIRTA